MMANIPLNDNGAGVNAAPLCAYRLLGTQSIFRNILVKIHTKILMFWLGISIVSIYA